MSVQPKTVIEQRPGPADYNITTTKVAKHSTTVQAFGKTEKRFITEKQPVP